MTGMTSRGPTSEGNEAEEGSCSSGLTSHGHVCKLGPGLFGSWLFLGELWLSCSACCDMRAAADITLHNRRKRCLQQEIKVSFQPSHVWITRPVLSAWRASTTCRTHFKSTRWVPISLLRELETRMNPPRSFSATSSSVGGPSLTSLYARGLSEKMLSSSKKAGGQVM